MPANASSSMSPLNAAFRACRKHFMAAALYSGLLNLLFLAPTLYMLQVYDRAVPTRGVLTLVMLTVVFVFSMITLSLLDFLRARILVRASARLDRQMSDAVLNALMSRAHVQGKLGNAMREFDALRQTMTGPGILALLDAPWTPIYLIVCFLVHPALGVLGLLGALALLGLAILNERGTKLPMQHANEAAARAYTSLDASVSQAGILRALGMRRTMVARHQTERRTSLFLQAESSFTASTYMTLTKFVRLTLQSLALGLGAYLAIEQKISGGAVFAASLLVGRALAPVEQLVGAWRNAVIARSAQKALGDLFASTDQDRTHTLLPPPTGVLQVERLSLVNPTRDRLLLSDISFNMARGEFLGVVGPSGAGKSTLAKVVAGAMVASQGKIRFDGADIADWDEEQLAFHVGYVPQEIGLLQGTVKENITRFRHYIQPDRVAELDRMAVEAATLVGAHDMIVRLPEGYDTPLGLGGTGLSAGQAQRVALARAVFGGPSVLIMDEPNAHLDAEGEGVLVQALAKLKSEGVTMIIVAHRTGVLADVDRLLVLRDGKVDSLGTREELSKRLIRSPASDGAKAEEPKPEESATKTTTEAQS